ncbi:MAG: hypothetical protein RLY86_1775 [Pseudomonadota bacterium]|jgi:two-component system nitrate/nitrite response regulator NarL
MTAPSHNASPSGGPQGDVPPGGASPPAARPPTPIILIDSNTLSREGLRAIFGAGDFRVHAHAATLDEVLGAGPGSGAIGIILVDAAVLRNVGTDLPQLRTLHPGAHVVLLTDQVEMRDMADAIQAGADGILMKDISVEALAQSMRLVLAGEKVFPTRLASLLVGGRLPAPMPDDRDRGLSRGPGRGDRSGLSRREMQILRHLVTGESNKSIAGSLNITEATVKVHLKTLLRKINASNRTQAAIWALNHGMGGDGSGSEGMVA